MNRFWCKQTGQKLAIIICCALIFTGAFQNFVWAETGEQTDIPGGDPQYKIFLNHITVEGDNRDQDNYQQEFESSVSGNDIEIDGKLFQIGQHGEIVDIYGEATVSGNDLYILADVPQVDIIYRGNQAYFETVSTVSGNEGACVVLNKKHTLAARISIAVDRENYEPAASVYPDVTENFYYIDGSGNPADPQAVKAADGPFQVRAELCDVEAVTEAFPDEEVELVYRGYAEYGRDMELWDKEGNRIDQIVPGQYYNVGRIVVKGHEKSSSDPFGIYELTVGKDITSGKIATESTDIVIPSVSGGDATFTLHMENAGSENLRSNSICFLIDNAAPEIRSVRYQKAGETEFQEWTAGTELKDSNGIAMRFVISEEHGIKKVLVVYQEETGEIKEENATLITALSGDAATEYVYEWAGAKPDVHYTKVGLVVTDAAGNTTTWGNASYLLDHTAPQINRITWEKTEEPGTILKLDPTAEATITAKDGITLVYHVTETNGMGSAELSYVNEKGERVTIQGEQKRETEAYIGYTYTYRLSQKDTTYADLQLTLEDELGNTPEMPSAKLTAIIDRTLPVVQGISWTTAEQNEELEVKNTDVLVAQTEVNLIVDVEENNLSTIGLYYREGDMDILIGEQTGDTNFVFSISSTAYNYKQLFFILKDKSDNIGYYGLKDNKELRVIIDQDAPTMENLSYVYPQIDIWYRNRQESLKYTFTLKDYSDIDSVEMVTLLEDGQRIVWDLTADCKKISDRDEKGYYTYQITTDNTRFVSAMDQNQTYYFVVRDQWQNELSTITDPENKVHMLVDNTAPSTEAYVKFSGDNDKFYNTLDELVEVEDKTYSYGRLAGRLFNNSEVRLMIYVADLAADDAVGQAASGIKEVKVTYSYTEESLFSAKESTKVLSYGVGNNESVIKTPATVKLGDETVVMDEISFEIKVSDSQQITSIDSIEITDAAGNTTVIREYANAMNLVVDYVLDNKAPELAPSIPGSGYSKDANTYYYNTNKIDMAVSIVENNFFPAEVISNLKTGDATRTITMGSFQNLGSYNYRSNFTMEEGDGKYQFSLSYTDRSENAMILQGGNSDSLVDGTYTSPVLVLDTTPPVLNISYYKNGQNITDSVYAGNCINGDVTAVISITETNFDPDLVQLIFSAAAASDNQSFGITYNPSAWNRSGDTYTYTILCNTEGRYSLTASCVDKAGNGSAGVAASDFIVDKTIPAVNISYNATTENGYYNMDRVATVTVTDQNFDENAVDYVITTTGTQPTVGNWAHTAANGCDGNRHVMGCMWSSQVVFNEDANYTFTFNCKDKAYNISDPVPEEAFTIDKTVPVIRVSYDNQDALNDYYFKHARNATITITEHNFSSSDINLMINSPDGEINVPNIWRNGGTDVYVCEIPYDTDGDYSFDISYTDLAGNEAEAYSGDRFVIDLTAPELEIGGVSDRSANNGVIAPVVTYSDKNYDAKEVNIQITGVNHGQVELEHTITANQDGQTVAFMDFSHIQEMDDLYTLDAVVIDKAGNITEESILFSVNRFGSVYIFSEETQAVLDRFYTNQGPKLTVTEINVDTLEHQEISFSCDGNITVLDPNTDYTIQESGGELEWKEYVYEIAGSIFDAEGVYVVTIQSIDRAANDTTNRLREKNIEFTVDKTAPSVVIGGIEDGESYAETTRSLTIDAVDNIYLTSLEIYLNAERVAVYDEEDLSENYGIVSYEIGEMGSTQTVCVIAKDAAGNVTQTDPISFLISSNVLIRWFYNRPLFIGSIAGVIAVTGSIFCLIFRKRRKRG